MGLQPDPAHSFKIVIVHAFATFSAEHTRKRHALARPVRVQQRAGSTGQQDLRQAAKQYSFQALLLPQVHTIFVQAPFTRAKSTALAARQARRAAAPRRPPRPAAAPASRLPRALGGRHALARAVQLQR